MTVEDCKSRMCSSGGSCYSHRAGERCINKYMCGSYRSCKMITNVDGVCTGKLDGEPCTLNDQCESEFCSSGNVCTRATNVEECPAQRTTNAPQVCARQKHTHT